ncbi:hypothetical protein [Azospirillum sp. B4]|uniref:hypothetical protein n=1 Tax=Azospirillum sp. B4 TaxID=95605 RepID=UPI0003482375|nr:hypothetical protein [Azospirillum sp. B4]
MTGPAIPRSALPLTDIEVDTLARDVAAGAVKDPLTLSIAILRLAATVRHLRATHVTDEAFECSVAAQTAMFDAGDNDAWQAACTAEQQAMKDHIRTRIAQGLPPMPIVFGCLVSVGELVAIYTPQESLEDMIAATGQTLTQAITQFSAEPEGHA